MKRKLNYTAERMIELNQIHADLAKELSGSQLIEAFLSHLTEEEQVDALDHVTISWSGKPFANFQVQNAKKSKRLTTKIGEALSRWHGENADVIELKNKIQVKFPDIPTNSMRSKMKERGLVWCKETGAWEGPLTHEAKTLVLRIAGVVDEKAYAS